MERPYIEEEIFEGKDFTDKALVQGDYEACSFKSCNFSGADLSGSRFIDCSFGECDLSNVTLAKTSFQDVAFRACKMLGLHFENCNDLGLSMAFENCQLDHCSFFQLRLNKTGFSGCRIQNADFFGTELKEASFDNCDLLGTNFESCMLEKADFRGAFNFNIDPEQNRLKGAHFSQSGLSGLLGKYGLLIDS